MYRCFECGRELDYEDFLEQICSYCSVVLITNDDLVISWNFVIKPVWSVLNG